MSDAPARVRIWDAPVRLFHWSIVGLIAFSWWSAEEGRLDCHRLSGYATLTLILFRIAWGFVGTDNSRFGDFLRGPRAVLDHIKGLGGKDSAPHAGHNPLGGWSVTAMLLLMLTQCVLGLFAVDVDGIESGPLAVLVSFDTGRIAAEAHELLFNALLALIALHLAAITYYALVKHDNLLGPMITGRKRFPQTIDAPQQAPLWRALVCLTAAGALVYAAANAFWLH